MSSETKERSFRRALMKSEDGHYVTANFYEYGGEAEQLEGQLGIKAEWIGFVDGNVITSKTVATGYGD